MSEVLPAAGPVVDYFDGRSARAHRVAIRVADELLWIEGEGIAHSVPLSQIRWPERTRHGARLLPLPDGGSLQSRDGAAWDAWSAQFAGRRDSLVVRAQQHWRWTLASLLAVVLMLAAGYRWGLPLAAQAIVSRLPASVDIVIGDSALDAIDAQHMVDKSQLDPVQRAAIERSFADAVGHLPPGSAVAYHLEFRSGPGVGPNAFALPGGAIILTDELVERVHGDHDMIIGVLGHELGHLRHRHGMRMLVQASVVGAAVGALYGDFSALFALVPILLAQSSYSRDAEREADRESVRLMRANGISPMVMAQFFDAIRRPTQGQPDKPGKSPGFGLGLASHPTDVERVAFFKQAAEGR